MIKIEKGVPLPDTKYGGTKERTYKYPFDEMEIGDSFFVRGLNSQSFSGRLSTGQLRTGYKFTCRTVEGGVRVWRVQ